MQPLQYLLPTAVSDAVLVSSTVPETDYAAWNAATNYTLGQRCIRSTTHSVYVRLIAGVSATAPENDAVNWKREGPTNRWAMFDGAVGTSTSASGSISVTLQPGIVQGIFLGDLQADSVTITMTQAGRTVYQRYLGPGNLRAPVNNWYDYYYGTIRSRRVLVFTDLPAYYDAAITVTLNSTGTASLGMLAVGSLYDVGDKLDKPGGGGIDYSKFTTDDYGVTTITPRKTVRTISFVVVVENTETDFVTDRLDSTHATPCVWIGSQKFASLVVYGLCKSWKFVISGSSKTQYNLEIQGIIYGSN
jgi:hypothetical protein